MKASDFIIPIFLLIIIIFAVYKKVDVFEAFIEGASENLKIAVEILPALLALVVCVGMLRSSGVFEFISTVALPITSVLGFPSECIPLAILKPVSGSGATAMLSSILQTNHPDSFTGRVASVIGGATETTFYTIAVYFGAVKIKGSKRVIFASLLADITGFIFSVLTVRLMFG